MNLPDLADIRAARERIAGVVYRSPCPRSLHLSRLCRANVWCKLDHLQMTGSFKERGARNKLAQLTPPQRAAGIVAASAGNHASALSYHGQLLSIPVNVVMPKWAPLVKIANCKSLGANIILHGESFADAYAHAQSLAAERGWTFVPGFDDRDIIAGAGTAGLEILEDVPDVDAIIIPVGGGGLIAGVGLAVKAIKPSVQIIGVEPVNAPTLHESLKRGVVTRIDTVPSLADGLAIAQVGHLCFEAARRVVDRLMLVDEAQIAFSVLKLLELEKTLVEGAGAVSLAAAVDPAMGLAGKNVVLLLCGGNIDITTLSRVIERGLAADGRLCRLEANISDRPGSLARLLATIADVGASVKEIHHDRNFGPRDVWQVSVRAVLETRDAAHITELRDKLAAAKIVASVN